MPKPKAGTALPKENCWTEEFYVYVIQLQFLDGAHRVVTGDISIF